MLRSHTQASLPRTAMRYREKFQDKNWESMKNIGNNDSVVGGVGRFSGSGANEPSEGDPTHFRSPTPTTALRVPGEGARP